MLNKINKLKDSNNEKKTKKKKKKDTESDDEKEEKTDVKTEEDKIVNDNMRLIHFGVISITKVTESVVPQLNGMTDDLINCREFSEYLEEFIKEEIPEYLEEKVSARFKLAGLLAVICANRYKINTMPQAIEIVNDNIVANNDVIEKKEDIINVDSEKPFTVKTNL